MDWSSFSIGNAAGFIKGPGIQFDEALRSAATEITIGSITVEPRSDGMFQSNPGIEATVQAASDMKRAADTLNKRLWWSVVGRNPAEYEELSNVLSRFGRIELNLASPNLWGDQEHSTVALFDTSHIAKILTEVCDRAVMKMLRVKLSTYHDPVMILRIADILYRFEEYIQSMAISDLGQVRQYVEALGPGSTIKIICVRDIYSGERVPALRDIGASGIQIGTTFGARGGSVFSKIKEDASAEAS